MTELSVRANDITDASLYDAFISFLNVRGSSIRTYKTGVKRFLQYLIDKGITQPDREDVISFISYLEEKDLKPTTIHCYIVSIRIFFSFLDDEGLYKDITKRVKAPEISKQWKKDYLTVNQCKKLLKEIDQETEIGKRDYALIALLLTGGLRTIEAHRANIEDIRPRGADTVLYIQGKGRSEKTDYIKLVNEVEDAIRDYLACRKRTNKPDEPLFVSTSNNSRGSRLSTRSISGIVKSRLINAGLNSDRLTAHSLRHTTGAINLLSGASLEETSTLLRHASTDTTRIYTHMIERDNNESERRIADAIFN